MAKKVGKIEHMLIVFEPFPLEEGEEFKEFYVETYEARGSNPVTRLTNALKYSKNPYMKILFMGHRGSGKSTELFLLRQNIQDQFEVIAFSYLSKIDPNNMTFVDFIFVIMSKVVEYIEKNPQMNFVEEDINELYKYWNQETVSETTETESGEFYTGFKGKLSFLKKLSVEGGGDLKLGSERKTIIREKMEKDITKLLGAVNQIIDKINRKLVNKRLVFIVEDLDKLDEKNTAELFVTHRKQLFSINARMILTFPVFMAYDLKYNEIIEDVDLCQMLSIIKVQDQTKTPFSKGIDTLKEIVYKRAEETLFEEKALEFLIMKSGGSIRDLFQLIRDAAFEALVAERSKIELVDAQNAYRMKKSECKRQIRTQEDVDKLKMVYYDPMPLANDTLMMSLFQRGLLIEYNGERWCGIHPAIEDFLKEKGVLESESES